MSSTSCLTVRVPLALLGLGALFLTGCQNYTAQTAAQDQAVRTGSIESAVALANQSAEANKDNKDTVVYRLEQGAILRQAALARIAQPAPPPAKTPALAPGQVAPVVEQPVVPHDVAYLRQSIAAFNTAEERVNYHEEQAKIKVSAEAWSSVTNLANLPYRGYAYDKVMLNTYKALNYIQLGEYDAARVELNRVLQRQRDAVESNAKRIELAQEAARNAKNTKPAAGKTAYDVDKARSDPKTAAGLGTIDADLAAAIKPYGDYVNPFAVFIDGLFFMANGENAADFERARKSMERIVAMAPDNPYAKADLAEAEASANGTAPVGLTYVIFETGAAPSREEIRIDIPTFVVTSKLPYVGAAFPRLKYNSDYTRTLNVTAGSQTLPSALVSSMDSVVALEFKNELPSVITRTIISTVTKAAVTAVVKKQANDNLGWVGSLVTDIALTAANASLNIADCRTWRSLPKEFQYVRLATPIERKLTLSAGMYTETVDIAPGLINIVYVKSTNPTAKLLVHQFALKPDPAVPAAVKVASFQ
jgi:hypothetical protein